MSEEMNVVANEEVSEVETPEEETPFFDDEEMEQTPDTQDAEEPDLTQQFLEQFKIKYDGAEVGYESVEDLIADAQKGKNYERVLQQRDSYKSNPAYKYIDNYMKESGYNDPAKFVHDLQVNAKVSELVADGMTEKKAKAYAEQMVRDDSFDPKSKEIEDFVNWQQQKVSDGLYSEELTPDNIPDEVLQAYEQGQPLKEAYMEHMLKNIKFNTEQKTIEKIEDNKKKSAGSLPETKPNKTQQMTVAQINSHLSGLSDSQQAQWLESNWKMVEKSGYFG